LQTFDKKTNAPFHCTTVHDILQILEVNISRPCRMGSCSTPHFRGHDDRDPEVSIAKKSQFDIGTLQESLPMLQLS
jgi:hypothetical protein